MTTWLRPSQKQSVEKKLVVPPLSTGVLVSTSAIGEKI
jgi:hypothetical protein